MRALVELIDHYQPGFAERVRPASADTIEALEELAGPLPGAYRRFLDTMGGDMGGFSPLDADFDVVDRLVNYQVNASLKDLPYLIIAGGAPLEPGGSLFMDRSTPYAVDDCQIAVAPYAHELTMDDFSPFHAGLEELLYLEAYRSVRLPLFKGRIEVAIDPDAARDAAVVEEVLTRARETGFERVPPARRSALLERGDAAMALYRHPSSNACSFRIGAAEPTELRHLTDLLTRGLPLQVLR